MTFDEFEVCEIPFGWKDEYYNGFAHITPRPHGVMMKIPVTKREIETNVEIEPISVAKTGELRKLFYDSFVDSVEYLNQTKRDVKAAAKEEIANFFEGKRGIPQLELCKIAVCDLQKVGCCLVSKFKFGYKTEIIFVHPNFQRRKIGSALVADVMNALEKLGENLLWSEHFICNELSANWHRKFGFVEETDIMTAKFRRNYYRHETYRNEHFGNEENLVKLKPLLENAEMEVERLEAIEEKDFSAAWLSWRWDY